ncbi:MAG: metal ABC transporter solute-binding protein [Solirubrobacteraceae bacterium]
MPGPRRTLICASLVLLAGCGAGGSRGTGGGLRVVAAENFWGSIAAQLAGARGQVRSVVSDPATDPHSYTASAADSALFAQAQLAIVNGVGYDNWAAQALAASPAAGRLTLNVGALLGLGQGANPHQWYAPAAVRRFVDRLTADLSRLDPAGSDYFERRRRELIASGFARYDALRREIRRRYAGVPVGYSESIFEPLGRDLALKLATPPSFAKAVAEGTEITAQDKLAVDAQLRSGAVKVWIYNSQNATPDVQRLSSLARGLRIPVATVTETLSPAGASWQRWQVGQLERLAAALHRATGR